MRHDVKQESMAFLWFALALTDLRLRTLPHCCNRKLLMADSPSPREGIPDLDSPLHTAGRTDEILQLAERVRRAACHRFIFNMSCLRQALVLRSRLKIRGIPARLVYGARKSQEKFFAHAWVEIEGLRLESGPDNLFHKFG